MRHLFRRPPLLAFLALTAGLAGALVLLALLDAAIFRPIPGVRQPDRLVSIAQPSISYPSLVDFQGAAAQPGSGLDGIAAYSQRYFAFSSGDGVEERRGGTVVAGDYFGVLGARAALGRLLGAEDDRADAPLAIVLSHALWRDRFGGDRAIVGRELRLNGAPFTIVGVAAAEFRGLARDRRPDLWITAHAWIAHAPSSFGGRGLDQRGWSWLRTFGRLAPGADLASARARLVADAERQKAVYPDSTRDDFEKIVATPTALAAIGVRDAGTARKISLALGALVALLLALSVSSAAHLFLARAETRRHELATRLALGADRHRITALLLAEPLAASLAGVIAALLLARTVLTALAGQTLPGGIRIGDLGLAIDARVAAGGALLALAAGLAAGWLPARRLWRDDLGRSLGSARTVSRGSASARRSLTAAQVAISLLLISATALAARALARATAIETGYAGDRLGFVTLDPGLARLTPAQARVEYDAALAAVMALPQVESASLVGELPLDPDSNTESFNVPGYAFAPDERNEVELVTIGPRALAVLGVRLLAGREVATTDVAGSELVGVISKSFAERYFHGREPLGASVELVGRSVRVVGVAADTQADGPGTRVEPMIYLALAQADTEYALLPTSIAFRATRSPTALMPAVVETVAQAAPGVPVVPVGSFDDLLASSLAPQRFGSALFGLFSLVATLLAAVGLFGLVAHAAAARTRELGLRAALGAGPTSLVRLLVGAAFLPVALGGALGAAAALPLAFAARGLMVGLESLDLGAVAIAAAVLVATAALAALVPAWKGSRLDPVAALRTD